MGRTTDPQTGVVFRRRHHCRACGGIFCDACSGNKLAFVPGYDQKPLRVCDGCHHVMTFLGSLDQRSTTPVAVRPKTPGQMPMTPRVGGADAVWVVSSQSGA